MNERFKPGDLAWLRPQSHSGEMTWAIPPGAGGWTGVPLDRLERAAVTILRRARCGDYSRWHQRNHVDFGRGTTFARYYSEQSWLVIIEGKAWLINDKFLNKRRYPTRKPRG